MQPVCGSDRGGEWVVVYTLLGNAMLNDVVPQAWLADVFVRIHLLRTRLHELLPWCRQAERQQALAA